MSTRGPAFENTCHWWSSFVDKSDDTHDGREIIHMDLVPDSVKRALTAESVGVDQGRRHGRSNSSDRSSTDTRCHHEVSCQGKTATQRLRSAYVLVLWCDDQRCVGLATLRNNAFNP